MRQLEPFNFKLSGDTARGRQLLSLSRTQAGFLRAMIGDLPFGRLRKTYPDGSEIDVTYHYGQYVARIFVPAGEEGDFVSPLFVATVLPSNRDYTLDALYGRESVANINDRFTITPNRYMPPAGRDKRDGLGAPISWDGPVNRPSISYHSTDRRTVGEPSFVENPGFHRAIFCQGRLLTIAPTGEGIAAAGLTAGSIVMLSETGKVYFRPLRGRTPPFSDYLLVKPYAADDFDPYDADSNPTGWREMTNEGEDIARYFDEETFYNAFFNQSCNEVACVFTEDYDADPDYYTSLVQFGALAFDFEAGIFTVTWTKEIFELQGMYFLDKNSEAAARPLNPSEDTYSDDIINHSSPPAPQVVKSGNTGAVDASSTHSLTMGGNGWDFVKDITLHNERHYLREYRGRVLIAVDYRNNERIYGWLEQSGDWLRTTSFDIVQNTEAVAIDPGHEYDMDAATAQDVTHDESRNRVLKFRTTDGFELVQTETWSVSIAVDEDLTFHGERRDVTVPGFPTEYEVVSDRTTHRAITVSRSLNDQLFSLYFADLRYGVYIYAERGDVTNTTAAPAVFSFNSSNTSNDAGSIALFFWPTDVSPTGDDAINTDRDSRRSLYSISLDYLMNVDKYDPDAGFSHNPVPESDSFATGGIYEVGDGKWINRALLRNDGVNDYYLVDFPDAVNDNYVPLVGYGFFTGTQRLLYGGSYGESWGTGGLFFRSGGLTFQEASHDTGFNFDVSKAFMLSRWPNPTGSASELSDVDDYAPSGHARCYYARAYRHAADDEYGAVTQQPFVAMTSNQQSSFVAAHKGGRFIVSMAFLDRDGWQKCSTYFTPAGPVLDAGDIPRDVFDMLQAVKADIERNDDETQPDVVDLAPW